MDVIYPLHGYILVISCSNDCTIWLGIMVYKLMTEFEIADGPSSPPLHGDFVTVSNKVDNFENVRAKGYPTATQYTFF